MDSNDIYQISEQLRRESRSVYNRLRSIDMDAQFVTRVSEMLPMYPVIANERCGTWYVDPHISHHPTSSVYFKSTDGHTDHWKFSLRRANTHLFPIIAAHNGCILVDSTRRGKSMPDSFSRTIPIWCAVWNTAVCMTRGCEWDCSVYTPPRIVSESENSRMHGLVPAFAESLLGSGIDVRGITRGICKPLRPIWITQDHRLVLPPDFSDADFWPVICVSASSTQDPNCDGFMYVQGAADDHELWAGRLTPQMFWQHRERLLGEKSDCAAAIEQLSDQALPVAAGRASFIRNTRVAVGGSDDGGLAEFDAVIVCGSEGIPEDGALLQKRRVYLPIHDSKKGQAQMAAAIPRALEFAEPFMKNGSSILVHCAQGTSLSVCIALAILVKYVGDDGQFQVNPRTAVSKQMIQNRLLWITTSYDKANPSRAMLKQVNRHFMDLM